MLATIIRYEMLTSIRQKPLVYTATALLAGIRVLWPLSASAAEKEVPVCTGACGSFIDNYINPFVVLLTITVGVAAAISIVVAGIQYASSADDPGKVTKAKSRIVNTVIGLLAYIFLIAFLNYLIPGGLV